MPELPEVETVKNALKSRLVGKRIIDVEIRYPNIVEYPDIKSFKEKIKNQTINDISRYGKWLIFILDSDYLLSHLRMEGKYFFKSKKDPILKHEHIIFYLDDQTELRYMDVRKFGKMLLIEKNRIKEQGPFLNMGLEPWDKKLDESYLKEKYQNRKLPIKSLLLDQSIIVGIGNIYADEILFLSKINPLKKGNSIEKEERIAIIKNTKKVLENAIKKVVQPLKVIHQ